MLSALIIVGACFFAGASVAEVENTSYRQLSGILALLAHIRTRITYTHFSLEVIFADFYDDALEKCGFLACLKDARGGYSASFCEAVGRLTVTGETRDALLAFGRTLGGVSMREQYAALENTEAFLQEKGIVTHVNCKNDFFHHACYENVQEPGINKQDFGEYACRLKKSSVLISVLAEAVQLKNKLFSQR